MGLIVVNANDNQFLRYVGRSAYGLKSCLDRIRTGSSAQEANHRVNRNILFYLQNNCSVSGYYLLIEENDRIADQLKKQIIKGTGVLIGTYEDYVMRSNRI